MNAFLKNIAAAIIFGALVQCPALATTNVPIQVFLVNLSPQAITNVTWTNTNGTPVTSDTVASGGVLALGAMSVPESATSVNTITITQTAANGSTISPSFTLSNNCGYEPWQIALAQQRTNPLATTDVFSTSCYSGTTCSGVTPAASYTTLLYANSPAPNSYGVTAPTPTQVYTVCLSNNNQFAIPGSTKDTYTIYTECPGTLTTDNPSASDPACNTWPYANFLAFPAAYSSNLQSVVLGSYVPTGVNWDTSTAPAFWNLGQTDSAPGMTLSPTGLTSYIGTSVVIPYNKSGGFSYWPVTIYYGVDSNGNSLIPLVSPTQTDSTGQQLAEVYFPAAGSEISPSDAVNVPAYFTNFQDSGAESAYIPPNAVNTTINGFAFPMPCWPLWTTSSASSNGQTSTQFSGCNGAPEYLDNTSATIASPNSTLSTIKNSTEILYYSIGIF